MIKQLKECPRVLLQKFFITLFLGAGCLAVGAAYFAAAKDTVFLALSGILSIGCVWRSYCLYRMIAHKQYNVTEGICVGITPKPLRRYRSVRLMDAEGLESTLLLDKRTQVKIGSQYRIYFKKDAQASLGSEYLDTALSGDCFLGIENLGEFSMMEGSKDTISGNE